MTADPGLLSTGAHEIGHMLTNQDHTVLGIPVFTFTANMARPPSAAGWDNGGHFGGPELTRNLMVRGEISVDSPPPGQVFDSKRLWNDDDHIVRQIQIIRESRYVRWIH
jgi:hypothetical protein